MSEIDDIFASKAKPLPPPQPLPSSSKSSSKKKKKKGKVQDVTPPTQTDSSESATASTSKKRPAPETVVDTSDRLVAPTKRHKELPTPSDEKVSKPGKSSTKISDIDANFKDSRGTGDRRTTEEGWLVYREDELGIRDEGGDTPLCPFDCDCCF